MSSWKVFLLGEIDKLQEDTWKSKARSSLKFYGKLHAPKVESITIQITRTQTERDNPQKNVIECYGNMWTEQHEWMDLIKIEGRKRRIFHQLSTSKQSSFVWLFSLIELCGRTINDARYKYFSLSKA